MTSRSDSTDEPMARAENGALVGFTMTEPEFNWAGLKKSSLCSCFSYVLQLILVASCGSFLFGLNLSLLNTSLNHISWEYGWCSMLQTNPTEGMLSCNEHTNYGAAISTAVFIGAAIGSMTTGGFMIMGRRLVMLLSMMVFMFGIVASCCANSFPALLFARLVVGYAVGIVSVAAPTYMSEVTPAHVRGKFGVFHQLFITIGIFVAVLIGLPLAFADAVPTEKDAVMGVFPAISTFAKIWWRVMLGLGVLPVMLCAYLLMKTFPFETPKWYVIKGRYGDANQLLCRMYNVADARDKVEEIDRDNRQAEIAQKNGMTLGKAMKNSELRFVVIFGVMLSAFQQLGGINVFIANSNKLFSEAGLNADMATIASAVLTGLNVVMTPVAIFLIESLGRKSLLLIGTIGQTVAVLPAAILYWIDKDSDTTMWAALIGGVVFVCFFAAAYGPVLWVYLFEIYPSEISASAAGAATAANWIAGIVMVYVTAYIDNQINYTIFTIMSAISIFIILFWMRETKGRELGDSPYVTKKVSV